VNRARRDEERAKKARRDLDRMGEQSEKLFGAGRSDPPDASEDRIEIIGRRIGRSLGYVLGTGLIIYLLATYVFV
jgi:hypothetical protein